MFERRTSRFPLVLFLTHKLKNLHKKKLACKDSLGLVILTTPCFTGVRKNPYSSTNLSLVMVYLNHAIDILARVDFKVEVL